MKVLIVFGLDISGMFVDGEWDRFVSRGDCDVDIVDVVVVLDGG
jgi:hypothetical protein